MLYRDNSNKVIDEARQGEALADTVGLGRKLYLETYGCQMNFADSEIVASVLKEHGFGTTPIMEEADVVMVNTCAIRDNAEQRVRGRLDLFRSLKKNNPDVIIGVMGCMAERLKDKLLEEEKVVDIVVGPDAYRQLPALIAEAETGQKAVNVLLSREETYADISPVRLGGNGVCAFISITRGCDNMCSFCVVPFTRGRERSRDPQSIINEARDLFERGYREVTLLGQNVDSYLWTEALPSKKEIMKARAEGIDVGETCSFAQLMERVALISPDLRVRFSTSHPKDMTDDVLHVMAKYENVCSYIHLPVQSGNSELLDKMNRGYTREWYLDRITAIRSIVPDCGISTDIITGFCGETEEQHCDTLSLMEQVGFDFAYMFMYSERPGTLAARKFTDDIPEEVKNRRLQEVIDLQMRASEASNQKDVGKTFRVLVEGESKRSDQDLQGRTPHNKVVVFPRQQFKKGDYVDVLVEDCTKATLKGRAVN